jgi:hypothetical protein
MKRPTFLEAKKKSLLRALNEKHNITRLHQMTHSNHLKTREFKQRLGEEWGWRWRLVSRNRTIVRELTDHPLWWKLFGVRMK